MQPTVFEGHNKMRIFQEEIFGPVLSVTTFKDEDEALAIANDTLYGLGAGVWTRDGNRAYRMGRGIQAGPGVDQLLPRLPGARGVRRLQEIGHRPRDPQDDARPLPADQEPAGELQPEGDGLLLVRRGTASPIWGDGPSAATCAMAERVRGARFCAILAMVERVLATDAALDLIERLRAHGPLMFHQSGGCCDGSAPMCYPEGEFRVGGNDVHLGAIGGCQVYMDADQFDYWKHTQLIIDVVPGRGSGFSLEAPEGLRFLTRSRVFTDHEADALAAAR